MPALRGPSRRAKNSQLAAARVGAGARPVWPSPRRPQGRRSLPLAVARSQQFSDEGLVYVPNFLAPGDFQAVRREFAASRGSLASEGPSCAAGRLAVAAPEAGAAERIFRGGEVESRIREFVVDQPAQPAIPFRVEYREYPVGASMLWHSDTAIADPPQLELVYTVENTSDSVTCWAPGHLDVLRGCTQQVWTEPNSALIVRAGGPVHMVRPSTTGSRAILKAMFLHRGAVPLKDEWERALDQQEILCRR